MSNKKSQRYEQQKQEIRNKLNGRPYTIGLDMGVGSIGLAVVALEVSKGVLTPTDVVFTTSRIFTPSAGAAERRQKRGQRNAIRHKANRMRYLWKTLSEKSLMLPFSSQEVMDPAILRFDEETRKKDPYAIRLKGLTEQLTLSELGYGLYHIANHRGASSIRTFLDEEKSSDDLKAEEQLRATEKLASQKGLNTFIEILVAFNEESKIGYRNIEKLKTMNIPLPTRDIIESEIQKLLAQQRSFYPTILTSEYQQRIIAAMLYENEKIVPEPGNCPYYPEEKKLPKCHFLNEERRLWEAVNNARVDKPQTEVNFIKWISEPFEHEERKILFEHLRRGNDLTTTTVAKLFPHYKNLNITLQGRDAKTQKIKGFRFSSLESKSFWNHFSEEQKDEFISVWVNTPDDEKLKQILHDDFGLTQAAIDDAMKTVQLIGDYAPIGKTATKLILKYLEDGDSFTEAIKKGIDAGELKELQEWEVQDRLPYYGAVLTGSTQTIMGKYWHSAFQEKKNLAGFHKPHTGRDEEKYGRIANPVVHQSLNELRKLLNEIIGILESKPLEIVLEMGRELKLGAEKRDEISRDQNKREKESERLYNEFCIPNSLSKKYIQHFRLLSEQNFICPYCLQAINTSDIVQSNVDIDHILPREDTADDSLANKVIAHKHCNDEKGKRTPYAAFSNTEIWPQIMHYLDTTPAMKSKRWKFELNEKGYQAFLTSKGFLSRFKADNSYVATATQEYLRCLYTPKDKTSVRTLNGRETSILRKAWNLQVIDEELGNLHIEKEKTKNDLHRKNRVDNRHHSLDAIVAAYCSRSLIKSINTMSAQGIKAEDIEKRLPIPGFQETSIETARSQRECFSKTIKAFLELQGFVSIKNDHDINGSLVKDTVYSILGAEKDGDQLVFAVKKKVSAISVKTGTLEEVQSAMGGRFTSNAPKWYSEELKEKIKQIQEDKQAILQRYQEALLSARSVLETANDKLIEAGRKPMAINQVSISKKALELCGGTYFLISNNSRQKTFVAKEPTSQNKGFAYDTGSNLCLDLYHNEEGKLCGEIIRKVNAMNLEYSPVYKKEGFNLYERIYQGDVLEIDSTNRAELNEKSTAGEVVASVQTPNALPKRTYIVIMTFTEYASGPQVFFFNLAKSQRSQDASFRLSSVQRLHARKVILSPAGLVNYVSLPLVDLKKE